MATEFTSNLTDPLARLEWWIRREVLPGTVGMSAADRLKMILQQASDKSPFVKKRFNEAIYLVLNHCLLYTSEGQAFSWVVEQAQRFFSI